MIPDQGCWLAHQPGSCRFRQRPLAATPLAKEVEAEWMVDKSCFDNKNLPSLLPSPQLLFFLLGISSEGCAYNYLWFQRALEAQDIFGLFGVLFLLGQSLGSSYQGFLGLLGKSVMSTSRGNDQRPQGATSNISNLCGWDNGAFMACRWGNCGRGAGAMVSRELVRELPFTGWNFYLGWWL